MEAVTPADHGHGAETHQGAHAAVHAPGSVVSVCVRARMRAVSARQQGGSRRLGCVSSPVLFYAQAELQKCLHERATWRNFGTNTEAGSDPTWTRQDSAKHD